MEQVSTLLNFKYPMAQHFFKTCRVIIIISATTDFVRTGEISCSDLKHTYVQNPLYVVTRILTIVTKHDTPCHQILFLGPIITQGKRKPFLPIRCIFTPRQHCITCKNALLWVLECCGCFGLVGWCLFFLPWNCGVCNIPKIFPQRILVVFGWRGWSWS